MAQRSSFTEMKAEQDKMTASWKEEGRLSEAWVVADPEIVEIFSAGVAFGMEVGRRDRSEPAYSPDEWRKALREAVEKAAAVEDRLEKAREGAPKKGSSALNHT
jgi:hypothetical protein